MKKTVMIKKNYEFRSVLTKGSCYKGAQINVFVYKNKNKTNKLGIAISKKAGNSVKRNRIKRLIRENYKILEEKLIPGISIVILWKKGSEFLDFDYYTINSEIESIFIKANILL